MARAKSIHIGLNYVDANAYGGWDGKLNGCVNDANGMRAIATSQGFETTIITDGAAVAHRVIGDIASAANELVAGDILWVSYSGHGGQVQDSNGDEADSMDETWVLFDREVIDDELYSLWAQFKPGVRIFVTSDSCHSGTVAKMRMAKDVDSIRPTASNNGPMPKHRGMPLDTQAEVMTRDRAMYDTLQWIAGARSSQNVQASVILISGCQDNQLSYDGEFYGQFTGTFIRTWDQGSFQGTYYELHKAILGQMPSYQSPNYYEVGATGTGFSQQRALTVAPPAGAVTPTPAPNPPVPAGGGTPVTPPPPAPTRPVLRRGATGSDVLYLQQRLNLHGASLIADGVFGGGTESAVRSFQQQRGLSVDGVVGSGTWAALEQNAGTGGGTPVAPPTPTNQPTNPPANPTPAPTPTPTGGSGAPAMETIRRGDRGDAVMEMQSMLADLGYNISADGVFGGMTESIVRQFQNENGLGADGVVGPATWEMLHSLVMA